MSEHSNQSMLNKGAASSRGAGKGYGVVDFKGGIKIHTDKPLPDYDIGPVKAYAANGVSGDLIALVCDPLYVPRYKTADVYATLTSPCLLEMEARGTVFWPPAQAERFVFLYRHDLTRRFLKPGEPAAMGMRPDDVIERVVGPLFGLLKMLKERDFIHGSIRPDNMFIGGADKRLILGDCLTMPASYSQPALYETIERAMATPLGRGCGVQSDEMYALGVSLAVMLRQNDHTAGMSADEIVRKKIEFGSYDVITGKERFRGNVLELLRGLLHDDVVQRWGVDQVQAWMDGQRLSPKQAVYARKAPRPLEFNGKKYFFSRFLSMDLHKNPSDVQRIVESDELSKWLLRAVEDPRADERVEESVLESAKNGRGQNYAERLATNIGSALDLDGPLRYGDMSFMARAFGNVLVEAVLKGREMKPYVDVLGSSMVLHWVASRDNLKVDKGALLAQFDNCRAYIRQSKIGFGLERCLYFLNPGAQCLSSKLREYLVTSPAEFALACNDMCDKEKVPDRFLDRHSVAYLSIKDSKVIDSFFYDLSASDPAKRLMVELKCLALIQKRHDTGPLVALCRAFVKKLDVVYAQYNDKEVRERLEKNIKRFAEEGQLVKIAGLLDNADLLNKDQAGFRNAVREYQKLEAEAQDLEMRLKDKSSFGKERGQQVAAVISAVISLILMAFIGFVSFMGSSSGLPTF